MKIRLILAKGANMAEIQTPYTKRIKVIPGDTYDTAIIEDQESIDLLINSKKYAYEVI